MAPGPNLGASMSSTLVVPAGDSTQSPFPQTTNAGGDNNDNGPTLQQKGANYFFGFLIAFVVLLLVFVACGITSRRRFLARRGPLVVTNSDLWGTSAGNGGAPQPEPVFYERHVEESALVEDRWRYTMVLFCPSISVSGSMLINFLGTSVVADRLQPLSASLVRGPNESPAEGIPETDFEASAAAAQAGLSERAAVSGRRNFPPFLRSWLSKSSKPKHESSLDEKTELIESPESLEISVVIAMPSRPDPPSSSSSTRPDTFHADLDQPLLQSHPELSSYTPSPSFSAHNVNDIEKGPTVPSPSHPRSAYLSEYQIGVTTLPWHTELDSTSLPS